MEEHNQQPVDRSADFQADAILDRLSQHKESSEERPPFADQPPEKPARKKKTTKKGWLLGLVLAVLVIVIGMVLFCLADCFGVRFAKEEQKQITVNEGAALSEIAAHLQQEDVILSRHVFLLYVKLTGQGGNVNYGAHDFGSRMTYTEILESLAQPAKAQGVTVTVPSGKTVDAVLQILADAGVCSYEELKNEVVNGSFDSPLWEAIPDHEAMYYALEGYLFPDTYEFYVNDSPNGVIQKMLDNLESKFTPEMRKAAADKGYTTHEIMTMASVIELESCGYFDEMPKVSAIFYNRLNHWPAGARLLQSDPTMYYPYGGGAYNTYKIEGLPPGPMSNVTEAAIKAAVYPDETVTDYYFVTDSNGAFYYNSTLAAHEATITDLKNKGLWLTTPYFE